MTDRPDALRTPDGRYIIVRGRLWGAANPSLPDDERQRLVNDLMDARRAVKASKGDAVALAAARSQVNRAKTTEPWKKSPCDDFFARACRTPSSPNVVITGGRKEVA
jgi:hypothetical protein